MVRSLRMETVPVDHGILRGKTEDSRSGVAFLRQWSRAANFDDRRTDVKQCVRDFRMLVKTARDTNWVSECVAKDLNEKIF